MKHKNFYLLIALLLSSQLTLGQSNQVINISSKSTAHHLQLISKDFLFGLMDEDGNVIVKPKYDFIEKFDQFHKGWAMVSIDGRFGFIDATGREVVKPKYDFIEKFDQLHKGWAMVSKNGFFGFIDSEGNVIVKVKYDTFSNNGNLVGYKEGEETQVN